MGLQGLTQSGRDNSAPRFGGELDVQLLAPLVRIEPLSDQLPWRRNP